MWALLALGSAVAFCFVNVCDKRLLSFHLYAVPPLCLWCGLTSMVYGPITLLIVGVPAGLELEAVIAPLVAGLLMGCSVVLFFRGLRLMEASRAVAIYQSNPVIVAALAVLFLGERISGIQWVAIMLVVAGAALISMRVFQDSPYDRLRAGPPPAVSEDVPEGLFGRIGRLNLGPALLGLSAICAGSSFVVAKAALNADVPVLTVFAMQQLVVGCVFLAFGLTGGRRLLSAMREPRVLGMLLFGESLMPAVSILLSVYAYSLGPASLVAAVLATRPLFVFVATTVLSRVRWQLLDESLTPRALAVKGASILMIVVGVGALSLG